MNFHTGNEPVKTASKCLCISKITTFTATRNLHLALKFSTDHIQMRCKKPETGLG